MLAGLARVRSRLFAPLTGQNYSKFVVWDKSNKEGKVMIQERKEMLEQCP